MKTRVKSLVIILLAVSLPLAIAVIDRRKSASTQASGCLGSFDAFAYSSDGKNVQYPLQKTLPEDSWSMAAVLPQGLSVDIVDTVEVTRRSSDGLEIWIKRDISYGISQPILHEYVIYHEQAHAWSTVSASAGNTGVFVDKLYVGRDGSVWGRNVWDFSQGVTAHPLLSRFDEKTGAFEFDDATKGVPGGWVEPDSRVVGSDFSSEILLDPQGIFWIVPRQDRIYSYNPATRAISRFAEISNVYTKQAVLAPDGHIYIDAYLGDPAFSTSSLVLQPGEILQFSPQTNTVTVLTIPPEPWPIFSNLLVDRSGRLWLGAVGWRDPNGAWHRLYPQPLLYFWKMQWEEDINWYTADPSPVLASSNGRTWFSKGQGDKGYSGMAWLDPKTLKGCWFTSQDSNIVEDQNHDLWILSNGELYRGSLGH